MTSHKPDDHDEQLADKVCNPTNETMIPPSSPHSNDKSDDTTTPMDMSFPMFGGGLMVISRETALRISMDTISQETISGGGKPSGPLSFMHVQDATGGTIKSAGKTPPSSTQVEAHVSGDQRILTAGGPIPAAELADSDGFVGLAYDRRTGRYVARRASIYRAEDGPLMEVETDKGRFQVAPTTRFGISPNGLCRTSHLDEGRRLFACSIDESVGYPRVSLRDGSGSKRHLHRLVALDVMGVPESAVIHHIDENKYNARPENLHPFEEQGQHARHHNEELVKRGEHVFQNRSFPKVGASNPMHRDSAFWQDRERSQQYRDTKRKEMQDRDPVKLQRASVRKRLLAIGHRVRDAGFSFLTMPEYLRAHERVIGRIGNHRLKREGLIREFGSIEAYNAALDRENHKVLKRVSLPPGPRYRIEVARDNPFVSVPIVIWPIGNESMIGSGVTVYAP